MEITFIIITLILSAYFSGMEIAYVSSNKIHIELEKQQDTFFAKSLSFLTKDPSRFIIYLLLGNSISLVIYGFYSGELIIKFLFPEYIASDSIPISVVVIQTVISALVILLTAEFLPKVFFQIYSEKMFKISIIPSIIFFLILYLPSSFIMALSNFLMKYIMKKDVIENKNKVFTKTDLDYYLSEQIENTPKDENENMNPEIEIFRNALNFGVIKARDTMIRRTEIVAIDINETPEKLKFLFVSSGHSKVLVFEDSIDNIVGYAHAFELFKETSSIKNIVKPIEYIPETMPVQDILNILIRKHKNIAVILDEYGVTSGIITLEDIIEKLFGNIQDEYDKENFIEDVISENEYKFSARLNVDYINKKYNIDLPESTEYSTLGGLIVFLNEDIPSQGDLIESEEYSFEILDGSETKINTVIVKQNR